MEAVTTKASHNTRTRESKLKGERNTLP